MEGQILGNRYELIEKIGGGGMAIVYKAKCKLLNRFVAIKMLRPEFTNDEEFVKRFSIEAQSAASLSHPNVVSIYDVGYEGSIHYIVMEYIDGITLKEYITRKGALKWDEAVKIAIQICSAIEHAHKNHIVHRDIKPHNILLTRDGIAKVTDFGIARAVSSSTITMVGSTIGSVHYFSPEQARGGFIDEKSDLYSLGIALYEMVTGRVPFDGESPVAVALKHLQSEAEPPVSIDENIPESVNGIIMKAIKKEQGKRYQTASDMLQDLYQAINNPNGSFVFMNDTESSPTRKFEAINESELTGSGKTNKVDEKNSKKSPKKSDKLTYWMAGITSFIIILAFGFITYNFVVPSIVDTPSNSFVLDNYVGKNYNEVKDELGKSGIEVIEKRKSDESIAKDTIMAQSIEAGKTLKVEGISSIEFTVSDGPKLVKIPEGLKNKEYLEAEIILGDLGLTPRVEEEYSDTVGEGLVIRTSPEMNEEVKVGTEVIIYKSIGPELKSTKVPDLTGKTKTEAEKLIADAKLKVGKITPADSIDSTAKIIKQDPLPNSQVIEETPVNMEFAKPEDQRKNLKITVLLNEPDNYGDIIKVHIEAVPSDTNTVEYIVDEEKNKTDFPLPILVPIPEGGKTKVSIYLDDKLYNEFEQEYPGR